MWSSFSSFQKGYINSSHPNFIGGSKAVELAVQQLRSSQVYSTIYVELNCSSYSEILGFMSFHFSAKIFEVMVFAPLIYIYIFFILSRMVQMLKVYPH